MELTVKELITREEFHDAYLQVLQTYYEVTKIHAPPPSPANLEDLLNRPNHFDFSIESDGKVVGFIASHHDPQTNMLIIDRSIRAPTTEVGIIFEALWKFLMPPTTQFNNQE